MKLATYRGVDGDRLGLVVGTGLVSLADHLPEAPRQMVELIARWEEFRDRVAALQSRAPDVRLDQVRLRAPIPRPGKIMAIGLNYKDHIEETNSETPPFQTWFSKAATSANGPYDRIALPAASERLDYEAELVAVIGKRVRGVTREQAKAAIFGYCVGDDVSVRDWQIRVSQWVVGKSFDTHAPFGPWITTADETDARDLDIRCLVNGEVRQASNTAQLLFDCYAQVEHLSQAMTLEPGDVLFTGTPSGVGHARQPQVFLRAGDVVRIEIDKLGHIENKVEAEPATGFSDT
jgi:2-keto-4-pentenoate hydratase/2-oxohepta-3-ene-1,7-dioic acid hydratase in catechol pathway